MFRTSIIAMLAAVIAAPSSIAAPSDNGALHNESLQWDGITRTFTYYEPSGMNGGNAPLMIVLHGGGQDALGAINSTEARFNDAGEVNKFWVVYPEGQLKPGATDRRSWNDCRAPSTATGDGGYLPNADLSEWDDVGFINELVDWFIANKNVDSSRVYVGGASNGGMMTHRMMREATSKYAGFAPFLASQIKKDECLTPDIMTLQNGSRKMLLGYGDKDKWHPPEGKCLAPAVIMPDCREGENMSIDFTIDQLKSWFGVTWSAPEVAQPNTNLSDWSRQHWRDHYRSGSVVLRVVRVQNGGHSSPGDEQLPAVLRNWPMQFGWKNLDNHAARFTSQFFGLCTVDPDCY